MSIKKRIQELEAKVHSTGKPKPCIVRLCKDEDDIQAAERGFKKLDDPGRPFVIVSAVDSSRPRPVR